MKNKILFVCLAGFVTVASVNAQDAKPKNKVPPPPKVVILRKVPPPPPPKIKVVPPKVSAVKKVPPPPPPPLPPKSKA